MNTAADEAGNSLLHMEGIDILDAKEIAPKVYAVYVSLQGFSIGKSDLVSVEMDEPFNCKTFW